MKGQDMTGYGSVTLFRRNRRTLPGFLLLVAVLSSVFALSSCNDGKNRQVLAERMAAEEGQAGNDARIAELKANIKAVDADVEETISSVRKKADYWRLLGLKYMDYRMWGEAMNAFGEALAITPDHAPLHYNRGLCAGQMSLSAINAERKADLLATAEASYRRSLVLDDHYTPAMYGLSVLLVFELSRPGEAVAVLDDYLAIERSDTNARFLLARAYLEIGRIDDALDLYEEIIRTAADASDADKADDLYNRVLGGDYGS